MLQSVDVLRWVATKVHKRIDWASLLAQIAPWSSHWVCLSRLATNWHGLVQVDSPFQGGLLDRWSGWESPEVVTLSTIAWTFPMLSGSGTDSVDPVPDHVPCANLLQPCCFPHAATTSQSRGLWFLSAKLIFRVALLRQLVWVPSPVVAPNWTTPAGD
jgi:hypothetical protein